MRFIWSGNYLEEIGHLLETDMLSATNWKASIIAGETRINKSPQQMQTVVMKLISNSLKTTRFHSCNTE